MFCYICKTYSHVLLAFYFKALIISGTGRSNSAHNKSYIPGFHFHSLWRNLEKQCGLRGYQLINLAPPMFEARRKCVKVCASCVKEASSGGGHLECAFVCHYSGFATRSYSGLHAHQCNAVSCECCSYLDRNIPFSLAFRVSIRQADAQDSNFLPRWPAFITSTCYR